MPIQKSFDDTPVGGSVGKENFIESSTSSTEPAGDAKPKRPFLKRGQGRNACAAGARALELQKRQERAKKAGFSKPAPPKLKATKTSKVKAPSTQTTTRKVTSKNRTKQSESLTSQLQPKKGAKTGPIPLVRPSQQKFSKTSGKAYFLIPFKL